MGRLGIVAGLKNIVEDLTPQLGGDLDGNGSDITGMGHIGFLASQDPSAGANDLDDYEEGTFTPEVADASLDGSGEGQAYSIQVGRYTKIGDRVYYSLRVTITDLGTLAPGESVRIVGLPFTSNSASNSNSAISPGFGSSLDINVTESLGGFIAANQAYITMELWSSITGTTGFTIAELSAGGGLIISGHYGV